MINKLTENSLNNPLIPIIASGVKCYQCSSADTINCSDLMIAQPDSPLQAEDCSHVIDAKFCVKSTALNGYKNICKFVVFAGVFFYLFTVHCVKLSLSKNISQFSQSNSIYYFIYTFSSCY